MCILVLFVLAIDLPLVLHCATPRDVLRDQRDRPDDIGGAVAGEVLPSRELGRQSLLGEDVAALEALNAERRSDLLALSPLLQSRFRDVDEQGLLLNHHLIVNLEGLAQRAAVTCRLSSVLWLSSLF